MEELLGSFCLYQATIWAFIRLKSKKKLIKGAGKIKISFHNKGLREQRFCMHQ
jgi:hypothetical protein